MEKTTEYATKLFDVTYCAWEGGHTLRLKFDDGSERIIDFAPILRGSFWGRLQDVELFKQVRLDTEIGTIVWPGGLDIDPTVLHDWPAHVAYIVEKRQRQEAMLIHSPALA